MILLHFHYTFLLLHVSLKAIVSMSKVSYLWYWESYMQLYLGTCFGVWLIVLLCCMSHVLFSSNPPKFPSLSDTFLNFLWACHSVTTLFDVDMQIVYAPQPIKCVEAVFLALYLTVSCSSSFLQAFTHMKTKNFLTSPVLIIPACTYAAPLGTYQLTGRSAFPCRLASLR